MKASALRCVLVTKGYARRKNHPFPGGGYFDNNNQEMITKNIGLITKTLKNDRVWCIMNKIGGA